MVNISTDFGFLGWLAHFIEEVGGIINKNEKYWDQFDWLCEHKQKKYELEELPDEFIGHELTVQCEECGGYLYFIGQDVENITPEVTNNGNYRL